MVGYPVRTGQHPYRPPFVIGNGEFSQSPGTPTNNYDDVAAPHSHDLTAHQAVAGINHHVDVVRRAFIFLDVLLQAHRGGYANGKSPPLFTSHYGKMRKTGTSAS